MSAIEVASSTQELSHVIGGDVVASAGGERFESRDPHDGSVLASVPRGDAEDARRAVGAARQAFDAGPWPRMSSKERRTLLYRLAELLEGEADELAALEVRDTGRPISTVGAFDVQRSAHNLRFFADYAEQATGESYTTNEGMAYVRNPPAGVVVAISPWNLPLMLSTWKVAPALAFGNTVVLKPAEQTPLTATRLGELGLEAGLPDGVLNVVHGFGPGEVGEALTTDERINRITFTGASVTGQAIMAAAAKRLVPVSFELGGKSASIVVADADMERTIPGTIMGIYANNGEMCLAGSRLLVQRSILDEFTERFVEAAEAMRVGDPKDSETQLGPLIEPAHVEKVHGYVELGVSEGGELLTGGEPLRTDGLENGCYYPPTVLRGLSNETRTVREEIFGPVQTIIGFDDEAEALRIANDSDYGLAAMLWTTDLDRAHQMSAQLEAGTVWVNCFFERDLRLPFGGVGASGIGREGGPYSHEFFTEPQAVVIKHREPLYGG